MYKARCILLILALATPAAAQSWYPRHNFSVGFGGAQPKADLSGLFHNSPGLTFGYGYRFSHFLQADIGFDTVFGAGGVRAYEESVFGFLRIKDYQFFLPFGGRVILPLARERFLLSGGGGGAWMKYTELIHQPSNYLHVECFTCTTRSGWGYYALAGADYVLDSTHHFRIGALAKMYRGHTNGEPLAAVPGVETHDQWLSVFGQFGFSF